MKALLLIIITSLGILSCNPYNRLADKMPSSLKDSSNLALRCEATFPQSVVVVPGKPVSDTMIELVIDTSFAHAMRHTIDSLATAGKCKDIDIDSLEISFAAKYRAKVIYIYKVRVDTLIQHDKRDSVHLEVAKKMYIDEHNRYNDLSVKLIKMSKYVWMFWILAICAVVSFILFILAKFKIL